ncbi:MAG: IS5 family transposase [Neisseriaceae bacterium]|nr:IS5 family transposase [Neisseriaceae bacterium]
MEYQICDRQSFKEFLGLTISNKVPDAKTIWAFREKLVKHNVSKKLFEEFNNLLKEKGLILKEGRIANATFLEVPRQHNTRKENEAIKQGKELWEDKPNKKCPKDIDARWVKKGEEKHFGYKNHIVICKVSKMISSFTVIPASVHDSNAIELLLNKNNSGQTFLADNAYTGKPIEKILKKLNMNSEICEKCFRNNPLTEKQKLSNNIKSKMRARVGHSFSVIKNVINGSSRKLIGIKRITEVISIINLIHNMTRYEQIIRLNLLPVKE